MTDPGFIQDARLRSYSLKGRKLKTQAHPGLLESSVEASLDNFIHRAAKRKGMDKQTSDTSKNKLLFAIRLKVNQIFRDEAEIPYHSFLSKQGLDELASIQEHMVITYAEKSAHDFVTCCKHVYKKLLWDELHSPQCEASALSSEEIFSKHTALSAQIDRPCAQARRYLYGILKMHKAKVGMRWIAGNHMQAMDGPIEQGN